MNVETKCRNHKCERYCCWNPTACICGNSKYLKNVADTSVSQCDKNAVVMDIASTKKTNTIITNFMSTASINCHSKNVRDHIAIDNYYHLLSLWKTKSCNITWKIINF